MATFCLLLVTFYNVHGYTIWPWIKDLFWPFFLLWLDRNDLIPILKPKK